MGYNFTAQLLKGTNNEAADTLSCHLHHPPNQGDDLAECEIDTNDSVIITTQLLSTAGIQASALDHENLCLQEF